jgi:hypothetical protein
MTRSIASAAVILMTGCAGRSVPQASAPLGCAAGDSVFIREVLYFGRSRPGGGTVDDTEWQGFMDQVIAPRFPLGLTVVSATGQWRDKSGRVERERSQIVTVFHSSGDAAGRAVTEITTEYKRRFQQEAVLRERMPTCARFE